MTLHHSSPSLELRAQGEGKLEGYASVFGGIDFYGDTIAPGAYAATLKKHQAAGTVPLMFWSHRMDAPVGRWEKLAEDTRGLHVAGQLNLKTAAGRDAYEHLRAGDLNGLSVGFQIPDGGSSRREDGVLVLKEIDLHEVSIVALPADSRARITSVKSRLERSRDVREFEELMRECGYSRREARLIALKGFVALEADDDPSIDPDELQRLHTAMQSFTSFLKGQ